MLKKIRNDTEEFIRSDRLWRQQRTELVICMDALVTRQKSLLNENHPQSKFGRDKLNAEEKSQALEQFMLLLNDMQDSFLDMAGIMLDEFLSKLENYADKEETRENRYRIYKLLKRYYSAFEELIRKTEAVIKSAQSHYARCFVMYSDADEFLSVAKVFVELFGEQLSEKRNLLKTLEAGIEYYFEDLESPPQI